MATTLQETLQGLLGTDFRLVHGPLVGTASPADEAELGAILAEASAAGVCIVPRGAASSPYSAATAEKGLVISFEHLNRVREVDAARQLVTLEPGVLWQDLIGRLAGQHLAPRVYPSSRAFSTVGGFVAQGGMGIGSFEFGPIDRSVEWVRLLDVRGHARELAGKDLELVVGAEGRTGLLACLTLSVQPLRPVVPVVGLFETSLALEACIGAASDLIPPPWSVSFIDPVASAVPSGDAGRPRAPLLPAHHYAALLLCRANGSGGENDVEELIRSSGGTVSDQEASVDRWIDRFMGLQAIRTTPIPIQFRLPEGQLSALLELIPPAQLHCLGFEGVAVDGGQEMVVRLLFARRAMSAAANIELANILLEAVKAVGGTPYATGAFFPNLATLTYGEDRLGRLREFALQQDPDNLLNPGRAF